MAQKNKFITFGWNPQNVPSVQTIFKDFINERGTIGQKSQQLNEMGIFKLEIDQYSQTNG